MMKKHTILTLALAASLAVAPMAVLAQQNDPERTIPLVCDAFSDRGESDRISFYMGEGIAYYYAGLYGRAETSFTCIIEQLDAGYVPAFTARGQVYMAQRNYQEAMEDYGSALNLDSTLFGALNNRGVALASMGDNEEAMEMFDGALSLNSGYRPARVNRAVLNASLDQYEDAIADLEQVIEEAGLEDVLTELQRPDRPADAPAPNFDPIDNQAYAILGIVYSDFALRNFRSYINLSRGQADGRVQSAAGSLESRANFDLRLEDGSYYLMTDFISDFFSGE